MRLWPPSSTFQLFARAGAGERCWDVRVAVLDSPGDRAGCSPAQGCPVRRGRANPALTVLSCAVPVQVSLLPKATWTGSPGRLQLLQKLEKRCGEHVNPWPG